MQIDAGETSSNFSPRGDGGAIKMIVIHSTEGTRRSDIPIFLGQTYRKVSAHYYVQRDGKVFQFVPDNKAAWHAGVSSWLGRSAGWIQSHSIGIELENLNTRTNKRQDYPTPQMTAVIELVRELVDKYGVAREYVVRHSDIAPLRKADPAFFDWNGFLTLVFAGGVKPRTLVPESNPVVVAPETPYETEGADWLNPQQEIEEKINTAAETAVSNAFSGMWVKLGELWNRFLDSLRG